MELRFCRLLRPYPGAFDPGGEFDYFEIWTGVTRNFFNEKLELKLYNYWSPEYFGETGDNDVLEFSYEWTFNKVWYFTPKLGGNIGHQWGDLGEGGYDYTYWSVALTLGFNEKPALELEIRYWDSFDVNGFTCPPSGVDACNNLVVGLSKRHSDFPLGADLRRLSRQVLFAGHFVQHRRQTVEVPYDQCPAFSLDQANARKAVEFAGHCLTMGADAACDIGMRRRRIEARTVALARRERGQAEQFGLDAVVDGERAEFTAPLRQGPHVPHERSDDRLGHDRLGLQQFAEVLRRHGRDEATCPRLYACRAGLAVDGGVFAENVPGHQIAKTDRLAGKRVDRHADLAGGDEEDVVGSVEIVDDRFALLVAPP